MMNELERKLAEAYDEVLDREIAALNAEAEREPHVFSDEFERKMDELFRTGKPNNKKSITKRGKRVLLIAIAAVLALTATACAVPEIRESIAGFFVRIFSDHVEYTDPQITKDRIEEEYGLVPIPDGFEQTDLDIRETGRTTFYKDSANVIKLIQSANRSASISLDNETGRYYEKTIGDKNVRLYVSDQYMQASWVDNGYFFFLSYSSFINTEVFESWIDSVKELD